MNGKIYPYLAVEPRRYRLRLLNASNQRFFTSGFKTAAPGGRLADRHRRRPAAPLQLTSLLLPPTARVDLILDLTGIPQGRRITLMNDAH